MSIESIFSYVYKNTIIHKTNSFIKLVLTIILTVLLFSNSIKLLVFSSLTIIIFSIIAKTKLTTYKKIVFWAFFYGFVFLIINIKNIYMIINTDNNLSLIKSSFYPYLLYLTRLSSALLIGFVFYETTTTLDIREAVILLFSLPFFLINYKRYKNNLPNFIKKLSLEFTLTLIFIPRIFLSWNSITKAYKSKNPLSQKGIISSIKQIIILVPALIIFLLESSKDTARSIQNRS